jgi:hypothetical protein
MHIGSDGYNDGTGGNGDDDDDDNNSKNNNNKVWSTDQLLTYIYMTIVSDQS